MQETVPEREWLFSVEGMHCIRCIRKVQNVSSDFPAIKKIKIDLGTKLVKALASESFSVEDFINRVRAEGFEIKNLPVDKNEGRLSKEGKSLLLKVGVAGACAGNIMLLSAAEYSGADLSEFKILFSWLSFALFVPILTYASMPFYRNAYYSLKNKSVSIDTPIAIAILAGGLLSFYNILSKGGGLYFDSIAMFIFFLLASRYLIFKLQSKYISPVSVEDICSVESVEKKVGEGFEPRQVSELKRGDLILLKKGDYLPVDGEVVSEKVTLSDAFFSGEFVPKDLDKFDKVLAGSKIFSPEALIRVETVAEESRLSEIVSKLNRALNTRTPISSFTDKGANYLTLIVIGISALLFLYFFQTDMQEGVNRVLALLVVACPCGLAIATPLVQSLGVKFALEKGLLIKNASVFEKLPEVKEVVFDKTGTLTKGQVKVLSWLPEEPKAFEARLIYTMEKESEHPIAKALIKSVGEQEPITDLKDIKETFGVGVSAYHNQNHYEIKSFKESKLPAVALYENGKELLRAELYDEVSESAAEVVSSVQSRGLRALLLSGDKKHSVEKTAEGLGFLRGDVISEVSPEEKEDFVKKRKEKVLYVGDGVNDSLAMSHAYVSLSMDSSADVAYKSSDVHILSGGLSRLLFLMDLSQRALLTIKWILFISLVYNIVFAGLAIIGQISPLGAVIIMPLSSISVTFFGFYMLYKMKGKRQ